MNTRLYRLTPAGGKPNHYTDSFASAALRYGQPFVGAADRLQVGEQLTLPDDTIVERVA